MKYLIHDYAGHPFPVGLSRELARRGHRVTHAFASELLTPRGVLHRRPGDPSGLEFRAVAMSPDYRRMKYNFVRRRNLEVGYGRELVRLLDETAPDVVLSGQTPTEPQWMMTRRARALGIPVVTWVQDFYSIAVERLAGRRFPLVGWLAGRWYRRLDRRCLGASAAVVAITEDFRPILRRFGVAADRVHVVPNWAPIAELPLRPKTGPWARRHLLDGRFVFLYSGTLAMKHNPALLVRLAQRFADDADVRIVVVSEGPGRDFLARERAARGLTNLVLLPFQSFAEMPDALASADILVTVLEDEAGVFSVPSKILTYLCAGRALLASIPGKNLAARIILEAGAGAVVPPAEADAFVDAAVALRNDAGARRMMGSRARAYAEERFDIARIADRFEGILTRAAAVRERAPQQVLATPAEV